MSRYRSRKVVVPYGFRLAGSHNNPENSNNHQDEDGPGGQNCLGDYQWAGCDSRYITSEEMTDDATLTSGQRPYKAVVHTKKQASVFGGQYAILHFTPPSPQSYYIGLNGYLTADMVGDPTAEVPWSDLVVDLAKQVEDSIRTDFMGAVFLKELRETVTMIRNPFGLFSSKLRRSIPRGITARSASSSQDLASFWLEYRYGWRPLFSDVSNCAKLVAQMRDSPAFNTVLQTWVRFSKSYKTTLTCPPPLYPQGFGDGLWNSCLIGNNWWNTSILGAAGLFRLFYHRIELEANVSCEKLVPFGKALTHMQVLLNILGTSNWMQLRDTLWEVLPFSFVVDWFINFNNIWRPFADARLQQADIARMGYSIKRTLTWHPEFQLCYFGYWYPPILPDGGSFLPSMAERRVMAGSVGTTTSYQRSTDFPPDSDTVFRSNGLNVLRTLDGLSLFLQRVLK